MPKQDCPITQVATLLSDTWTMLILRALTEGPKRFCELETWLDGISTRTLTLKLQRLTDEKMIIKNANGAYTVTEKGAGIKIIENAMIKYGKQHLKSYD